MQLHLVKSRLANSYVIEECGRLAIVDIARGGAGHVAGHVEKVLQRRLSDIKLIVCTHDDFDHIGGIYDLARVSGAEVGIPHASRHMARKFFNEPSGIVFRPMTMFRELFRPRMWSMYASPHRNRRARAWPHIDIGSREPSVPDRTEPDFLLKHGQTLPGFPGWQTIHTPGHSWDSCCYHHAESGTLLSGDALLGSGSKGRIVLPGIQSNPKQYARTFRHLEQLRIEHIHPGHGTAIHGSHLLEHLL